MQLFFAQMNIVRILVPLEDAQIGKSSYAFTFKYNFTAEESLGYIRKN